MDDDTTTSTEFERPTCSMCQRKRDPLTVPMDAYDYNPMQVVTGQTLGWYSGDDGEICGSCMTRLIGRANA